MLHQMNIYGKDRVQQAIERLQTFEPEEGYYLAFSGGKDSVTVKALMDMAGVKYDAHYSVTSVDPPELVQFVKKFNDVIFDYPTDRDGKVVTMWNLIPRKRMPPTRIVRYCCKYLKEGNGKGRFVVTGVRQAESAKRKGRSGLELGSTKTAKREMLDPDNPSQELIHICPTKAQRILNPIVDWSTDDVWEFIHEYNVPYCRLYDEGFERLGCVGCPMSTRQESETNRWPKIKKLYIRAFERMIEERKKSGLETNWKTGEEVLSWWFSDKR